MKMAKIREVVSIEFKQNKILDCLKKIVARSKPLFKDNLEIIYDDHSIDFSVNSYIIYETKSKRWFFKIGSEKLFRIYDIIKQDEVGADKIQCEAFKGGEFFDIVKEELQKYADTYLISGVIIEKFFI